MTHPRSPAPPWTPDELLALAGAHLRPFNGHVSLYGLECAARLLEQGGKTLADLTPPLTADRYTELLREANLELARRLLRHARQEQRLSRQQLAQLEEYLAQAGQTAPEALGCSADELDALLTD